ncbi:DNA primase [Streptomyces huasconensis]|uniref:DNA primase n=1 Tax=Streptomyces huasconensis TaxID=1854574 RepID=UPI0033DAF8DF
MAMGLAVGAGYVLGRTKKAKFAFAVGTMVAGKKLNLSPKALGSLVTQQLENNPQFKEIGDQLRQDLRGVGKAATGSLLNRQLEGLADRLHDRTLDVQDRIAGVVPDKAKGAAKDEGEDDDPDAEVDEDDDPDAETDEDDDPDEGDAPDAESEPSGRRGRAAAKTGTRTAAKKTAAKKTAAKKTAAKKAPAKKTARKTAEKTARKPARKAAQKKTSSAARTGGRAKGGRDHG